MSVMLLPYVLAIAFIVGVIVTDRVWRRARKADIDDAHAAGYTEGLGRGLELARRCEQRQRFKNRLEQYGGPSKN